MGFAWVAAGGLLLTVGDVIFKFWVEKSTPLLYASGLIVYVLGLMCLVQSYKSQNIAVASAAFVIINIATLLAVSWLYFHAPVSPLKMVGIAFAIVAIGILEVAR